jgi:hypothetical protein
MLRRILRLVFRGLSEADSKTNAQGDGQYDKYDDEEAPPLELVAVPGMDNCLADMLVSALEIRCRVLSILLCALNERFLCDNELVHFIEQSSQLSDRAFDSLELVVAGLDGA